MTVSTDFSEKIINLIKTDRQRESATQEREKDTEAESDRGRVIYSPAFRRLQQKAQVFSLESNAAVRSRLTHSIEVSQTGRFIADLIISKSNLRSANNSDYYAFKCFIESACLMHDIGNPPFGHFGEEAIKDWFKKNGENKIKQSLEKVTEDEIKYLLNDFINFDGNPQGLRIVSKLQRNKDEFGLNLTSTTLASFMKYVRGPNDNKGQGAFKKIGYFNTEQALFEWIFGCQKIEDRHPFSNIIEAADDISYFLSDIEDSVEKKIISQKDAFDKILEIYLDLLKEKSFPTSNRLINILLKIKEERDSTFTDFRIKISTHFCNKAAENFIKYFDQMLCAKYNRSLIEEDSIEGVFLKSMQKFCRSEVYDSRSVQKTEYAGYQAISGLMNYFGEILEISREEFNSYLNNTKFQNKSLLPPKLYRLIPERYIQTYKDAIQENNTELNEWLCRSHLITDYICGMTDHFSMKTYRELTGIEI